MKRLTIVLVLVLCVAAMNAGRSQTITAHKAPGTGQKVVVDIEMTDVYLDDVCRVWVRYSNKGNTKIDKLMREATWVDGVVKDSSLVQVLLDPGAVFAHGVGADPGVKVTGIAAKHVKAMIDVENVLTEVNEANNTKEVDLKCAMHITPGGTTAQVKPDLVVAMDFKQMTHNDSTGQMVYSCNIQFTVTNQSSANAGACKIYLEVNSGPGGSFVACGPEISVPALGPNQPTKLTSGPYKHSGPAPTYRATVDYHNVVDESNETNNTTTKTFPQ